MGLEIPIAWLSLLLFGSLGLLLMLAGDGVLDILGILVAAVATPPSAGGVALLISSLFARGAAEHRPLA